MTVSGCSTAEALPKRCLSTENPFVSDKPLHTRYFPWYQRITPVRWPCSARDRPLYFRVSPRLPKFYSLPEHGLSRVFHVCCTSFPSVPPVVVRGLKFWAVQNFLPRRTPFRFFSASCHVYKSTAVRLKLDINANNIVCFTGDNFWTGFGRDQAVKRCVTGPLHSLISTPLPHISVTEHGLNLFK